MSSTENLTIESSPNAAKKFEYPRSPDVQVNGSDLTLELIRFERAVKNRITFPLFAAIISLWAPFFTSDFKENFGFSSNEIKACYFGFALMLTVFILKPLLVTLVRWIPWVPFWNEKFQSWIKDNECDPETKARDILKKCFPDKKE